MRKTTEIKTNSTQKIYKQRQIIWGAILGGPLAAGYMAAQNFNVFCEFEKIKKTWIISILTTLICIIIRFAIMGIGVFSNALTLVLFSAYIFITKIFIKNYQKDQLNYHAKNGGKFYNYYNVIKVSIIGISIFFSIYLLSIIIIILSASDHLR